MGLLIAAIGLAGAVLIFLIPAYILNGLVLVKLWLWFIVPFGLEPITTAPAIGLALIVGFLTRQYVPGDNDKKYEPLIFAYLSPLITLLIGWVVTWFI